MPWEFAVPEWLDLDLVFSFGTFIAAAVAIWVAWKAYKVAASGLEFAKHEIRLRRQLETVSKSQEAAAALLVAGFETAERHSRWLQTGAVPGTAEAIAADNAMLAFERRAQVLGAYYPDKELFSYAIISISHAFSLAIAKASTVKDITGYLGQLRVDLGPFIRGPNEEERHQLMVRGAEECKKWATLPDEEPVPLTRVE
jgi:hypothetical protein